MGITAQKTKAKHIAEHNGHNLTKWIPDLRSNGTGVIAYCIDCGLNAIVESSPPATIFGDVIREACKRQIRR